jgi:predicted transcriptional regulator
LSYETQQVHVDVKAVHGDVVALLNAGLIARAKDGGIIFPYKSVKVEFLLKAA